MFDLAVRTDGGNRREENAFVTTNISNIFLSYCRRRAGIGVTVFGERTRTVRGTNSVIRRPLIAEKPRTISQNKNIFLSLLALFSVFQISKWNHESNQSIPSLI